MLVQGNYLRAIKPNVELEIDLVTNNSYWFGYRLPMHRPALQMCLAKRPKMPFKRNKQSMTKPNY